MSRRLVCLMLLTTLACCTETASPSAPTTEAQRTDPKLAARCAELGAIFDQYNTRRSEGSGGPDLERVGAGLDCQKGRYAQGIATLEELLRRNRTPYPPA
ncbi:MAG: hypothetical protein JOY64_21645 [Alphaproteobacteria bacterium]|nr:hypothetical protein [Alphaproteobacteria bacterium]MBV8410247.1 hypothetical protein [Alphaproteobacteria bacterium]